MRYFIFLILLLGVPVQAARSFTGDGALQEYLRTGYHSDLLACDAMMAMRAEAGGKTDDYAPEELEAYRRVAAEFESVDTLLSGISGKPKSETPFSKTVKRGGFSFVRRDYIGRHLIYISRDSDGFKWTIGVKYLGNFMSDGNDVKIYGYYHVGTNRGVKEIQEALSATSDLFPATEIPEPTREQIEQSRRTGAAI